MLCQSIGRNALDALISVMKAVDLFTIKFLDVSQVTTQETMVMKIAFGSFADCFKILVFECFPEIYFHCK